MSDKNSEATSDARQKLSRRSFFRLVGGGVAAAVVAAPYVIKEAITRIPVELGWTWYIDKSKVEPTLNEIIQHTLRNNKDKIVDNLFENNALLVKLHNNQKVLLEIDKISPEDQTQRMKVRLQQRFEDRVLKLKLQDIKHMDKHNQEQIIERTKLALQNKLKFENEDAVSEQDGSITYYDRVTKRKLANVKYIPGPHGPIKEVRYDVS